MKKTCKFIAGGVVTICVLAAIGAVTVARYAAKHMNDDQVDECDCDGNCENCDLNAQPEEQKVAEETAEPAEEPVEVTIDVTEVADTEADLEKEVSQN